MAIQIDKINDQSDGFATEFTVVNKYKRTFPARPVGVDQLTYAKECVGSIVRSPVEKPDGVIITALPVVGSIQDQPVVVDLDPVPLPGPVTDPPID